eukprot:Hpha_TRINITY_DN16747_c1_g1::TRINITY_DN16747_c1_g1_i1::g.76043::m.76043
MRACAASALLLLTLPCASGRLGQEVIGVDSRDVLTYSPRLVWSFDTGCSLVGHPAVRQRVVYLACADPQLGTSHIDAVCDAKDCGEIPRGKMLWNYATGAATAQPRSVQPLLWTPPRGFEQVVVSGGNPPRLFALNASEAAAEEPAALWSWKPSGNVSEALAVVSASNGTLLVSARRGSLSAVYLVRPIYFTAEVLWRTSLQGDVSAPFLSNGVVLINVDFPDTGVFLVALGVETGSIAWTSALPFLTTGDGAPTPTDGNRVAVCGRAHPDASNMTGVWAVGVKFGGGTDWSRLLATAPAQDNPTCSGVKHRNGILFLFTNATPGGALMALNDSQGGEQVWSTTVTFAGSQISCSDPTLWASQDMLLTTCVSDSQWIWGLSATTGAEIFRKSLPFDIGASAGACVDNYGNWRCPPPAPSVDDIMMSAVVPGVDGTLHALDIESRPGPPGPPRGKGSGWFSSIPAEYEPLFITASVLAGVTFCGVTYLLCYRTLVDKDAADVSDMYQVLRRLGRGAFGVVYLARRRDDGELVAMKCITCRSPAEKREALEEWRLVSSLQQGHPNMIQVFDTFVNGGRWPQAPGLGTPERVSVEGEDEEEEEGSLCEPGDVCIVMPYFPEGDLKQFILSHRESKVKERIILSFGGQIASLLSVLHARTPPLIHRDLKPQNVLLADTGKRVVVTDFGLARRLDEMYCCTQAGTLAYVAPELWEGRYSTEVDVWGLGCILYTLATRRVAGARQRVLWREAAVPGFQNDIVRELRIEGYGSRLAELVAALLAPNPRRRPSAQHVVDSLGAYTPAPSRRASAQGISSSTPTRSPRVSPLSSPQALPSPSPTLSPRWRPALVTSPPINALGVPVQPWGDGGGAAPRSSLTSEPKNRHSLSPSLNAHRSRSPTSPVLRSSPVPVQGGGPLLYLLGESAPQQTPSRPADGRLSRPSAPQFMS